MKQNFYAWVALSIRSFGMLALVVLASNSYTSQQVAVWLTLQIIASMQSVFDFGISPAVMRYTIYSLNKHAKLNDELTAYEREKLFRLRDIPQQDFSTYSRNLFLIVASVFCASSIIIAAVALAEYISASVKPSETKYVSNIFLLIALHALGSFAAIAQLNYATYLNAAKRVTELKRMEAILGAFALIAPAALIVIGADLALVFLTVTAGRFGMLLGLRALAKRYGYSTKRGIKIPKSYLNIILPQTARIGVAIAFSTGVTQVSFLILASTLEAAEATSYLFGLRIIYTIVQFSNVPFYTRLPYIISSFIDRERILVMREATRLINFSVVLLIAACLIAYCGLYLSSTLGVHELGVIPKIHWMAFVSVFSLERLSSMYSQMRSLNNRIDWHKLNGINGAITLLLLSFMVPNFSILGFIFALGAPIMLFHYPYSAYNLVRLFSDTVGLIRHTSTLWLIAMATGWLIVWALARLF